MARRRNMMAAGSGAVTLAAAAFMAAAAHAGCAETVMLEYEVEGGWYQVSVNDVYLDSGAAQFTSGGTPIADWLLRGENTVTVKLDAVSGTFTLYAICADGSGRRDLDAAALSGQAVKALAFEVADPPARAYLDAGPTTDAGLLDAVSNLKDAFLARDFDAVWGLHAAMRADMALNGQPMKAAAYQMRKIVEHIEPEFAPGLVARPVLAGRVWEVYGDDFTPPISDEVDMNGGFLRFQTGSFWMRGEDGWSVLQK